jgi:hypothetical protein
MSKKILILLIFSLFTPLSISIGLFLIKQTDEPISIFQIVKWIFLYVWSMSVFHFSLMFLFLLISKRAWIKIITTIVSTLIYWFTIKYLRDFFHLYDWKYIDISLIVTSILNIVWFYLGIQVFNLRIHSIAKKNCHNEITAQNAIKYNLSEPVNSIF